MKNFALFISILVVTGFVVAAVSFAATTADVTAVVTVEQISVTVSDGAVDYGTVSLSGNQDTTNTGVDDTQTATNNGNVTEDFNVQGTDSQGWTLASSIGSEQYVHNVCTSSCDGSPLWKSVGIPASYASLATGITTTTADQDFDMQILVPSATATSAQQSVDITVQAVAN